MTPLVLVILAVMWTLVLLPPWLRSWRQRRTGDSIQSFRRQLTVLERATPGYVPPRVQMSPLGRGAAPVARSVSTVSTAGRAASVMSLRQAQKRRRDITTGLAVAAIVTLGLVPFTSRLMLVVHLVLDALLLAYVLLLARARRIAAEREAKLRYLPVGTDVADPVHLLRHFGSRA